MNRNFGPLPRFVEIRQPLVRALLWTAASAMLASSVWAVDTREELNRQLNLFSQLIHARRWDDADRVAQRLIPLAEVTYARDPVTLAKYINTVAKLYDIQERYQAALPLFERAMAIRIKQLGANNAQLAEPYDELADCLYHLGRYADAVPYYQRALALRERGPEAALASALMELAWAQYMAGQYDDAEPVIRRCVRLREKINGAESVEVFRARSLWGNNEYWANRYDQAISIQTHCVTLATKLFGREHLETAEVNFDLAKSHYYARHPAEAQAAFEEALAIHRQVLPEDAPALAENLKWLGQVYLDQELVVDAEAALREALPIAELAHGDSHASVAEILAILGNVRWTQHRTAEAIPLIERAVAIREKLGESAELDLANSLSNLGAIYAEVGRFAEAEPLQKRALEIRQRRLDPGSASLAISLVNLGALYRAQGRNEDALPLYQQALAIREALDPPAPVELATCLTNLGNLYVSQGNHDAARPLFERAIAVHREQLGGKHFDLESSLSSLANLYVNESNYEEAEKLYREALAICEEFYGSEDASVASRLGDIALVYYYTDRWDEALELLDRVVDIQSKTAVSPRERFFTFYLRARISWKLDARHEAIADLRRALDLADEQRGQSSGSERERATAFATYLPAFESMVAWQTEVGDLQQALDAMERARARSLVDELNLINVDFETGRPELELARQRQRESELSQAASEAEERLASFIAADPDNTRADERAALFEELSAARRALYEHFRDARSTAARFVRDRKENALRLRQVQKQLGADGTLLLVYMLGGDGGYLLTIDEKEAHLAALEIGDAEAQALGVEPGPLTRGRLQAALLGTEEVPGVLAQLSTPEPSPSLPQRLSALFSVLVPESGRARLVDGQVSRAVIVPDGPLAMLPFETLVVREEGARPVYLLDAGPPISYAPSVGILYSLAQRALPTAEDTLEILTVGDPTYEIDATPGEATRSTAQVLNSRFALVGGHLPPLPYSGLEAQWVDEVFQKEKKGVLRLTKQDATEWQVRENAPGRGLLHFACHGLADEEHGNFFGSLALTPGADARENSANDGFLSLSELYELDLSACELTILSACQTNFGPQQQGEGVWALSRGFLVAGSRRVVASNWVVDDRAAASLISYTCSELAKAETWPSPGDYGRALQAAKRWVRQQQNWSHPYYWASFELIGPQ